MERDQSGYATTNGLFAIIGALAPAARAQEHDPLFRRHLDSAGRPASVPRRHRRRQPRQRQHLHDGRGGAAHRERAGRDPRQVNQAGGRERRHSPRRRRRDRCRRRSRSNEDVLRQDPALRPRAARPEHRRHALRQHQQPPPGLRSRRDRPAQLLPARLHAEQRRLRRKFRKIEVKVKRPGVTVAARKGYFAVRDTGGRRSTRGRRRRSARSSRSRCRTRFPCARARSSSRTRSPGLVPVVVDLKTAPLTSSRPRTARPTRRTSRCSSGSSISSNQVVRKVSQHYEITAPIARDRAREAGRGRCSIASRSCRPACTRWRRSSYDAPSGKSSVRLSTVEVPRQDAGGAAHEQPGDRQARREGAGEGAPRRQSAARQGRRPLSEPRRSGQQGRARSSASISPSIRGGGPAAERDVELLQNGKPVAQLPMSLPRPTRPAGSSRSAGCRSIRSLPAPTSCAPSSSRGTAGRPIRARAHRATELATRSRPCES